MKRIYLDNAAATRLDPEVLKAMEPFYFDEYGVATSDFGNSYGVNARRALEDARAVIAKKLNISDAEQVYFTSGATESNNLAITGLVSGSRCKHIITSTIEHQSVLNVFKSLEKNRGCQVDYVPVDSEGFVDLEELEKALKKSKTALVSIAHANHEVGTIQDITAIGSLCQKHGAKFHCDATQSFCKILVDVEASGIDLLTCDASLNHGPKGIGALYVHEGVKVDPMLYGGFQEKSLRPGTENVPGIVGFGKAIELSKKIDYSKIAKLRDYLMDGLLEGVEDSHPNGPRGDKRLPNNSNVSFRYIEGEALLLHLDMRGIAVTTGSACFSQSLQPSHVILAMGMTHADGHGSMRMTLSKYNTKAELDYTIKHTREVVKKLREISPLTEIKGAKGKKKRAKKKS